MSIPNSVVHIPHHLQDYILRFTSPDGVVNLFYPSGKLFHSELYTDAFPHFMVQIMKLEGRGGVRHLRSFIDLEYIRRSLVMSSLEVNDSRLGSNDCVELNVKVREDCDQKNVVPIVLNLCRAISPVGNFRYEDVYRNGDRFTVVRKTDLAAKQRGFW